MPKQMTPKLRFVLVGAGVLVVVALLWAVLTTVLAWAFHWGNAPLIALVVIVVAGWIANGVLVWRQRKHEQSRFH